VHLSDFANPHNLCNRGSGISPKHYQFYVKHFGWLAKSQLGRMEPRLKNPTLCSFKQQVFVLDPSITLSPLTFGLFVLVVKNMIMFLKSAKGTEQRFVDEAAMCTPLSIVNNGPLLCSLIRLFCSHVNQFEAINQA